MMRALILAWMAVAAWGQDAGGLQFEAATIRLHTVATPSTGRSGIEETPGLIRIENLSLKAIIREAYGVRDFQFAGPGWLDSVSFDITAKPPGGYRHEQLQPLLRNLLASRFKLAVHHESKEVAGFALVAGKGGHKLQESSQPRGFFTVRPGLIEGPRISTVQLAGALARMVGRPVADQTGLAALYEIKLEWAPEAAATVPGGDERSNPAEPALSLFTALQDQLGLKLEAQKVTVDTVIVDHVERVPSEN